MTKHTLLLEIGTEELPPKMLRKLASAFADHVANGLRAAELQFSAVTEGATARRLTVSVTELDDMQPDTVILKKGPAIKAAYSETGELTKAALGFAKSCHIEPAQLETIENKKGQWLAYKMQQAGKSTLDLVPGIANAALSKLPIQKKMRWGMGEIEFVRPVHWVVALFGTTHVDCTLLGTKTGRISYGHRFHCPHPIALQSADTYWRQLEEDGKVIAGFEQRRQRIKTAIDNDARAIDGCVPSDPDLLDEITALVEWPAVITGKFDKKYLSLPDEILIAIMKGCQKYFPVIDKHNHLSPHFIMVANIESRAPDLIRRGNQRVLDARFSDAEFFWQRDMSRPLKNLRNKLAEVVFQKQLGSLYDKSKRIVALASYMADCCGFDKSIAERAGALCKCDLLTETVNELPELQGTVGRHCALAHGEDEEVALALEAQYLPRVANDQIPDRDMGKLLAIADKIDTLVGIFLTGMIPSGEKDPFALRRAALGTLRIMIEGKLDRLDLKKCLEQARVGYHKITNQQPDDPFLDRVFDFIMDRLRHYYHDQGVATEYFEAVLQRQPTRPYDFNQRLHALIQFAQQPEADVLAAANKRIANILKKANDNNADTFSEDLLRETTERKLAVALVRIEHIITPLLEQSKYEKVFHELATLKPQVDEFFKETMVMCDDTKLRNNRLALLRRLRDLLVSIADISKL